MYFVGGLAGLGSLQCMIFRGIPWNTSNDICGICDICDIWIGGKTHHIFSQFSTNCQVGANNCHSTASAMKPWKWPTGTSRQVPRTERSRPAPPGVGRHLYLYSTLFSMYIHMYIRIILYGYQDLSLSIYIKMILSIFSSLLLIFHDLRSSMAFFAHVAELDLAQCVPRWCCHQGTQDTALTARRNRCCFAEPDSIPWICQDSHWGISKGWGPW